MSIPKRARKTKEIAAPLRKPMAPTRRVSLFERQVTTRLSPAAFELLMEGGATLSEGTCAAVKFSGSTMLTLDLTKIAHRVSDPIDDATARRVALLIPTDDKARTRAKMTAIREAARISHCDLTESTVDVRARALGKKIHVDLDVEAKRRIA